MYVDAVSGLIDGVVYRPSPNADFRPPDMPIDLVVLHGISLPPGEFGGPWIEDLFLNRLDPSAHPYFHDIADMKVSAHVLIRRDGSLIQFVPFTRRAWHAGESRFEGRPRCNDYSIGIELEGEDGTRYNDVQYDVLADLLAALVHAYPSIGAVTGHNRIAPARKTDPGPAFDWGRLASIAPEGLRCA
jgi:AmpD protein